TKGAQPLVDGAKFVGKPVRGDLPDAVIVRPAEVEGERVEEHAGALPTWLAPVQVAVLNITDAQSEYCREIAKMLQNQGLRVQLDLRNEKITRKIREHSMQKLPYILVIGDKEKEAGSVAVRARGNIDLGVMSLQDFLSKVADDIASKV
ncbi:MAG: His/Gly/Thr/Pro-type tRNA ligase C-terminal domain-containing protein, partial [Burkholderiales bacterium]|nr:His/Gly/Thr/Pro-type tRNA ligase C-terminal domain-containing protein [Burkholderiales bacterium]